MYLFCIGVTRNTETYLKRKVGEAPKRPYVHCDDSTAAMGSPQDWGDYWVRPPPQPSASPLPLLLYQTISPVLEPRLLLQWQKTWKPKVGGYLEFWTLHTQQITFLTV